MFFARTQVLHVDPVLNLQSDTFQNMKQETENEVCEYKCPLCSKSFGGALRLKRHVTSCKPTPQFVDLKPFVPNNSIFAEQLLISSDDSDTDSADINPINIPLPNPEVLSSNLDADLKPFVLNNSIFGEQLLISSDESDTDSADINPVYIPPSDPEIVYSCSDTESQPDDIEIDDGDGVESAKHKQTKYSRGLWMNIPT